MPSEDNGPSRLEDSLSLLFEIEAQARERKKLEAFIAESNRIEGITRDVTSEEVQAYRHFMRLKKPAIASIEKFLRIYERMEELREDEGRPGKVRLRDQEGENVVIIRRRRGEDGRVRPWVVHRAPPGGPEIRRQLLELMREAPELSPNEFYTRFELLHPFMDGNGRAGRLLWAWRSGYIPEAGFLKAFHDQALGERSLPDPAPLPNPDDDFQTFAAEPEPPGSGSMG